jgi:hypothetical protein
VRIDLLIQAQYASEASSDEILTVYINDYWYLVPRLHISIVSLQTLETLFSKYSIRMFDPRLIRRNAFAFFRSIQVTPLRAMATSSRKEEFLCILPDCVNSLDVRKQVEGSN